MAVVRNLMIRIGADYSAAEKALQNATNRMHRFDRDVTRTTAHVTGKRGLGGIGTEFKTLGGSISSSLAQIRGAKGIGGVVAGLKSLRPALGSASVGLTGLGGAAGGATLALTGLVAAIGVATVGIYQASQMAVKFEADLGRLDLQLQSNSRSFMDWARGLGLAKTTAAEMGATYSTLLSSFGFSNDELFRQTQKITQTTRVVASWTGRTYEDVLERIRSGLLGNTEAIEDLGIFVNVSMMESTEAFKKFANGKSWDQLEFNIKQQILLAGILEQAHELYGDSVQNNVMTKQTMFMEQLKDIKLNLSQAFLPIWDAVLPALTRLAEALADVTEEIARFTYWLRGWDYDERTRGLDQQTEAVQQQGDAYEDLAKQARKARGELAAFDQLNLLGDNDSSGTGSGAANGGGGSGGGLNPPGGSGNGGSSLFPVIPPELTKRYRIEFDKPNPPDAGLGAVATAVVSTVNSMAAQTKAKLAQMWADWQAQTSLGKAAQVAQWGALSTGITGSIVPALASSATAQWAQMWDQLQAETTSSKTQTNATWRSMLAGMLADLLVYKPQILTQWAELKSGIASIKNPLEAVKTEWRSTLSYMQQRLNEYRPYLEFGWALMGIAIRNLKAPLAETKASWSSALSEMYTTATSRFGGIIDEINSTIAAISKLNQAMATSPSSAPSSSPSRSPSAVPPATTPAPSFADKLKKEWNSISSTLQWAFSSETLSKMWGVIEKESAKPENQAGASILGLLMPAAKAGQFGKGIAAALENLAKTLNLGKFIPAFATGGLVYGPTLAMVGDNPGARTDPEIIAPASMLEEYLGGGSDPEVVALLRQVVDAVRDLKYVQAVISDTAVTRAATTGINRETMRNGKSALKQ